MTFFRDNMGIDSMDPDAHLSEPLDNSFDQGGGNVVRPYVVADNVNHRIVGMKNRLDTEFSNARIHEVGFVYKVGRAGQDTFVKRVPYGTEIFYGYYIVEFENEGPTVLQFWD
eukprot:UN24573